MVEEKHQRQDHIEVVFSTAWHTVCTTRSFHRGLVLTKHSLPKKWKLSCMHQGGSRKGGGGADSK